MNFEFIPINRLKTLPPIVRGNNFMDENPNIMSTEDFEKLVGNIKKYGVDAIDPIRATKIGHDYYIVDGYHRYKACKMAGLSEVPVIVVETDGMEGAYTMIVRHNTIRGDYDVVRFARLVKALHDKFGMSLLDMLNEMNLSLKKFNKLRKIAEIDDDILNMVEGMGVSMRTMEKIADVLASARGDPVLYKVAKEKITTIIREGLNEGKISYAALEKLEKRIVADESREPPTPTIDLSRVNMMPSTKIEPVEETIGSGENYVHGGEVDFEIFMHEEEAEKPGRKEITYDVECNICDQVIARVRHIEGDGEIKHDIEIIS